MKKQLKAALLTMAMCVQLIAPAMTAHAAQTYYDNKTGTENGYDFELWKDYGTTSMTLNGSGTFDCSWSNIGNVLFREGKKFDQTKTYSQIGNITFDYGCNYQPNGNSYLCVYGWTVSPLVEYYIVDSWGTWRPPGASAKGQITVDGGTYDVYETTRVNQPSIQGNTTFQQYWSVRTSKRTSGTISVTEHFKAWERMGMRMGNLTEAALNVEGYQSQGQASVYKNVMTIGGSSSGNAGSGNQGGNQGGNTGNENAGNNLVKVADADKIQTETMTKGGQYTGGISSPFNGVALYGNNDTVKFTQNFTKGTHDFTLRGCSNNDNMARVDLKIGGQNKGTFYFGDANPAEYTIKNVSHGTGNQTVELVVTADDGQWDAYLDWLGIGGISSEGKSQGGSSQGGSQGGSSQSSSSQGGSAQTGSQGGNTGAATESSASTKVECEKMTKSGQYTGNISSPFNGVALYANNDSVKYTQNFTSGTHDFVLRGCSNNNNMARVDLKIGGQTKGTFYYGDANPAEYTIKNVSHGTGNQTVELVVTADDGQWDAYLDSLTILGAGAGAATGAGSGSSTNPGTGSTGGNNNQNQKLIALTFDDGPSSTTNDVLDILDKYDVKATFFLIGQQVNSNTLATMQRQVRSGHELASHSYTHEDMANMSAQQVRNQMEWTSSAIKNAVGVDVKFFRPPYISVSNTMYQNSDLAFICGSLCDDYMDNVSASERARKCIANAKDGEILLLHDFQGNSKTVQALPTIIETLQNQGYRFVTVSELFQLKGKNPNVEYKLWSNVNN